MLNTTPPLTAAAVAASFGLTVDALLLAAADDHFSADDVAAMSFDDLTRALRQHDKLIEAIRADEDSSPRQQRRLDEALQSRAVFAAELDNRPESHETRAQRDARPGIQAGRKTEPTNLPALLRQPSASQAQATHRMGLILNRATGSPAAALFGQQNDRASWNDSDEFFAVVSNGVNDPRLFHNATNVEGVGVDGGFLVPSTWYTGMIDAMLQESQLASRCRLFGTATNDIHVPMLDTSNRSASIAGIAAAWVAEATQGAAQKLRFRTVSARLKKMMILAEASNELLEDGIGYAAQLQVAMAGSTAYTLDEAIIAGTGVGQPLGFLNAASAIEISPESGQGADTIVYQNIVNMYSRVHPACQRNGVWLYNPNALPQLLQMVIPDTDGRPVLLSGGPNDAAAGSPAQTIFGRPALSNECMPELGDRGDLAFVDLTQYAMLMKGSARVAFSADPGFDRDVATWRMTLRADGLPMWDKAITPRNSSTTLSWCAVLAARAG